MGLVWNSQAMNEYDDVEIVIKSREIFHKTLYWVIVWIPMKYMALGQMECEERERYGQ